MANGIGRKITVGIAKEDTWGAAESSADFMLPNVDVSWTETVNYAENEAMLGSTYGVNNAMVTQKYINFTMRFKVDEDILPMLFLQSFSIDTSASAGESTVYDHTLTYSSTNSGSSQTLFWDDADRQDLVVAGAYFSAINLTAESNGFITCEITGTGKFPTNTSVTNSMETVVREFTGSHVAFTLGDKGGAESALSILTANANHSWNLSGDDKNFALGSNGLASLNTLDASFELEISRNMADDDIRTDYGAGTLKQSTLTITDTSREVDTSVASTNPSIAFAYPAQAITAWSRESGANDLVGETFTLKALDYTGVSTAPLEITVTNAVASY